MKNMLSEALCVIRGLLNQLLTNLEGEQGGEWLAEFKKFLRKEKCWVNTLLEFVGIITVPAMTKKLKVRDYILNLRKESKVYTGSNFEEHFFNMTIEPISKSDLRFHKLLKSSVDDLILAELGGKDKAETTLAEMLGLMEMQASGKSDSLLTNSYANIFYIRDAAGVLWAVYCFWYVDGWRVFASSVENPFEWDAGNQVFSRSSSEN